MTTTLKTVSAGTVVWCGGDRIRLSGATVLHAGAEWYVGHFVEGHKKGNERLMSPEQVAGAQSAPKASPVSVRQMVVEAAQEAMVSLGRQCSDAADAGAWSDVMIASRRLGVIAEVVGNFDAEMPGEVMYTRLDDVGNGALDDTPAIVNAWVAVCYANEQGIDARGLFTARGWCRVAEHVAQISEALEV